MGFEGKKEGACRIPQLLLRFPLSLVEAESVTANRDDVIGVRVNFR